MELAERFMVLFAGLGRAHGVFLPKGKSDSGKVAGSAFTEHEPVTAALWAKHLAGEQGLGVIPIRDDATCAWAALDVDKYDLDLNKLAARVKELDLSLVVARSKSGGAHLFLFCSEPISAKQVRDTLESWAVVLGFAGIEIFPKQENLASERDVGNWLNMPYFNAGETLQYGLGPEGALSPEAFLDAAAAAAVGPEAVVPRELDQAGLLEDGPPCLQVMLEAGISEGTRNQVMFNYGVYARKRFGDDYGELEAHLDTFNSAVLKPPLGSREVQEVAKHVMKKDYSFTCKSEPLKGVCQYNICRTRRFGIGADDGRGPPLAFGQLVKVLTDPPFYILEVEGKRIELVVEELYSQDRFRRACLERIDKVPPRVAGKRWDGVLAALMTNIEHQDAPPDASPEGQIAGLLNQWLTTQGVAEDQRELLSGKPWRKDDQVYFRSLYLLKYLKQYGLAQFTEQKLWKLLRRLGASHEQFIVEGKNIQCWSVRHEEGGVVTLPVPTTSDDAGGY